MDDNSPEAWYRGMPPVTKSMITVTFVVTLLHVFQLFNPAFILLDWTLVVYRLHFWRIFTDYLFIGPFSFNWLFHAYLFVTFSSKLESSESFQGTGVSPGTYLYFLVFQMLSLDFVSLLLYWPTGRMLMAPALSFAIIYYWSKKDPWQQVGLWGFTVQAYQFPFALLLLDLLLGNSMWTSIMGLLTGHLYYYLRDAVPVHYNVDLMRRTPGIFDTIVLRAKQMLQPAPSGARRGVQWRPAGDAAAAPRRPQGGAFPGAGNRLGGADGGGGGAAADGEGPLRNPWRE